jgi:hypothetical protein
LHAHHTGFGDVLFRVGTPGGNRLADQLTEATAQPLKGRLIQQRRHQQVAIALK